MEDETSRKQELEQRGRRRPEPERVGPNDNRNGRRPESARGTSDGTKRREPDLVPLEQIPAAKAMILAALNGPPENMRPTRVRLQREYPGRTPGNVQDAFRRMRDDRGELKWKHRTLTEEELGIVRAGYAAGRIGARAARKEVLRRRPDLNRGHIDRMVRHLGLGKHSAPVEHWSQEDHGYLMFWSEEKDVKAFVKRFGRSERAIRAQLSRYGASGRLRARRGYSFREAAALLGVSRTAVSNWVAEGNLPTASRRKRRAITEEALRTFCKRHPERIDRRLCSPTVLPWLPAVEPAKAVNGRRGHLAHTHACPKCGRTIQGNGYSTHERFCGTEPESSNANM